MASAVVVEQAEEDEACRVSHCVSELLDAEALHHGEISRRRGVYELQAMQIATGTRGTVVVWLWSASEAIALLLWGGDMLLLVEPGPLIFSLF